MSPGSPTGKNLLSPTTSKGLKKMRGQLPRPWPSCYAVFEMIKPNGQVSGFVHWLFHG
jgi:hypothetical protein